MENNQKKYGVDRKKFDSSVGIRGQSERNLRGSGLRRPRPDWLSRDHADRDYSGAPFM